MIQMKLVSILSCALTLQLIRIGHADTIVLHDGRAVSGKITGETAGVVTIDAPNGRFTFSRDKILTATKETPVRNQVREVEVLLAKGNVDAAVALLQKDTLRAELSPDALNNTFIRLLQPIAVGVISTSATAAILAESFSVNNNTSAELLLFAAALSVDSENQDQALGLMRQIEQNVPTRLNWPAATISGLINRIADAAVQRNYGSIVAISASLSNRLPLPPETSSTSHLNVYGQIEGLMRKKQFLQATALFSPELFLYRADLFVPLAERLMIAVLAAPATDSSLAALESARITLIPYMDTNFRLRCLKVLINRLMEAQRTEAAQIIVDHVATQDADIGSTLQHLLEFQKQRAGLPQDAPMEVYKLAAWGRSMGLLDESRELFTTLRTDPRFSETADLQLAIINNAKAHNKLQELKRLYDMNEIDRLKSESADFLRTSPPEDFAQQARDLLQLADFQDWSARRSSQGKAEAEFQQAERLANRREFDKALVHLNRIQLDRESTEAAKKANALRTRIMREKLRDTAASDKSTSPATPVID